MSLLSKEMLAHMELVGIPNDGRRTGRSTRRAFLLFAECYEKPNQWIPILDHYATAESDQYLMERMMGMAKALHYNFDFKISKRAIRLVMP